MVQQVARGEYPHVGAKAWLAFAAIVAAFLTLTLAYHDGISRALLEGSANRELPSFAAPSATLHFSRDPADREFLIAGGFEQPLVPVGTTSATENLDLARAITAYNAAVQSSGGRDAVGPLTQFLQAHPNSAWRPALLVNLGSIYRETGHFSKAMAVLKSAWALTKQLASPNGRLLGDVALADLTQFQAYLGLKEELKPILEEARNRDVHGAAAELVSSSSRGLAHMQQWPERSFRCGPLALMRIAMHQGAQASAQTMSVLSAAKSTDHGLSLTMVQQISAKAGMNYQMAYRPRGARIVLPAVAHWKMGHYAAIVGYEHGRYLVQDSTFGEDISVTAETLDEEASGYFLIPAGPLPTGWRAVGAAEGAKIWGRGDTGGSKESGSTSAATGTKANPSGSSCNTGGCTTWNVEALTVSLLLHDRPLTYKPPVGPTINIDIDYSHRDSDQPAAFNYTNLGSKWTINWLSYVTDTISSNRMAVLYVRGGGTETFTLPSSTATVSALSPYTQSILTRTVDGTGKTTSFTRVLKDGSQESFGVALGAKFFLTQITDPQGNAVKISYDTQYRIMGITDAIGQVTTFAYSNTDPLKITKITDPFGRTATFTYNASSQLASITDSINITSSFTYGAGDFVNTLTTPYGASHFVFGDSTTNASLGDSRFITATDALGRVSRVEFNQTAFPTSYDPVGAPSGSGAQNVFINFRNSFIWNPEQLKAATAAGGLDYSKARLIHWLHTPDGSATSRVIESTKEPKENRVWYRYAGQPNSYYEGTSNEPTYIGRVLDNGTSRAQQFQYNNYGSVTQAIDPVGRQTNFSYASNGIDPTKIVNGNSGATLATIAYNGQHLPVMVTGANGATATYSYDSAGRVLGATNALGQTTTYGYNGSHYLTTVTGPTAGATYGFTYDSAGRIATATDPASSKVNYVYDSADRPTKITFPDGTFSSFAYTLLDLTSSTDRLGRVTTLTYDAERQLTKSTDPLNQVTQFAYTGSGKLASITDPNGHVTSTTRDIDDRVIAKIYADGTQQTVAYENSIARVHTTTDALGQVTTFAYNADDTPASVTYTNAPKVSFTYDAAYQRPLTMIDGTGTTTYAYGPVGKLGANRPQSIASPIAGAGGALDTISYAYDALDRVATRTVNGFDQTTTYDALGRVASVANALDNFTYAYGDGTNRVSTISSIRGPKLDLAYYDGTGDELVKQMTYTAGGKTVSQFGYSFDANDNVTKFTQSYLGEKFAALLPLRGDTRGIDGDPRPDPIQWALAALPSAPAMSAVAKASLMVLLPIGGFVAASLAAVALALRAARAAATRLRSAASTESDGRRAIARAWRAAALIPPAAAMTIVSACGSSSNSVAPAAPTVAATAQVTTYQYDNTDRLLSAAVGTDVKAASSPQYQYQYDAASNLTGITSNGPIAMLAYTATNAISSGTYDANGSPLKLDSATYSWDGANRLVKYVSGTAETDFVYDGLSRLVEIIEKTSGTVTADHAYTWCGQTRCLERDNRQSGAPVDKQYFELGELQGTTALYYVTDRLGSVRQLVDTTGAVQAQYEYDSYGNRTKITGSKDSDFGFTGLFHHASSGLDFAVYRAYDASRGRWTSRDPLGETGPSNLYEYVSDNPSSALDPLGLYQVTISGFYLVGGQVTFGVNGGQFNLGAHFGLGEGASLAIDPRDSGCQRSGFNGSVKAEGQVGFGPGVDATSEVGFRGSSAAVSFNIPQTPIGLDFGEEDGSVDQVGATFTFGESGFVGVGGTAYF